MGSAWKILGIRKEATVSPSRRAWKVLGIRKETTVSSPLKHGEQRQGGQNAVKWGGELRKTQITKDFESLIMS